MHSNKYTLIYSLVISAMTAVILVVVSVGLKPQQDFNLALDQKKNILKSLNIELQSPDEIEKEYSEKIEEFVVDGSGNLVKDLKPSEVVLKYEVSKPATERKLPVYVYKNTDGTKNIIVPVYGVGLWGPIWGFLSFEKDLSTLKGSFFDHKGETPGLGAEISEKTFRNQFIGKKIKDANNTFISVNVLKKNAKVSYGTEHRVDGISGGTITSDGTSNMISNCVEPYLKYFATIK